jgi:WD40 repeat protein
VGDKVQVWDWKAGKRVWEFAGHRLAVNCVVYVPHGQTLISSSQDGTLRFWDLRSGKLRGTLVPLNNGSWFAATPEGHWLVSDKSALGLFRVQILEPGKEARELSPQKFVEVFNWKNEPGQVKQALR